MVSALRLQVSDGFTIFAENRLDQISPYIFLEQETWFESETNFVRAFARPGMKIVDVGANCGFYTLLCARQIGNDGHVWAFEPGAVSARLLKESLRINALGNVTLYEAAAGSERGSIWLSQGDSSELNTVSTAKADGALEVRQESLDALYSQGELKGADFLKLDAEGFEEQVLIGASTFLACESPVVMIEVSESMRGVQILTELGYERYCLLPDADWLIPFRPRDHGEVALNVLMCKPDRAKSLHADGLLVTEEELAFPYPAADPDVFLNHFRDLAVVRAFPALAGLTAAQRTPMVEAYYSMCAEFLLAQDRNLPRAERAARLARARCWVDGNFCDNSPFAHALTLGRVWPSLGRKPLTAVVCETVLAQQDNERFATLDLPFLPVLPEWDSIALRDGDLRSWLVSMMQSAVQATNSYSSCFVRTGLLAAYADVRANGYLQPWLERRAALTALSTQGARLPDPLFLDGTVECNRAIWHEIAARLKRGETMVKRLSLAEELS